MREIPRFLGIRTARRIAPLALLGLATITSTASAACESDGYGKDVHLDIVDCSAGVKHNSIDTFLAPKQEFQIKNRVIQGTESGGVKFRAEEDSHGTNFETNENVTSFDTDGIKFSISSKPSTVEGINGAMVTIVAQCDK